MKTRIVAFTFVGVVSAISGDILCPILVIVLLFSFLMEETLDKMIELQGEIISLQEKEIIILKGGAK